MNKYQNNNSKFNQRNNWNTDKERNDWFDDECKEVIVEKNKARNKCLNRNTRVNREDYEQKRIEARNLFKKKKRELLKKKIEELR